MPVSTSPDTAGWSAPPFTVSSPASATPTSSPAPVLSSTSSTPQPSPAFFEQETPQHVILAAAKVGGILANNTYPADFIRDNLIIQTNVIESSRQAGADRLLFLGSSCIYPKLAPQPMPESCLLTGPLEPTNRPYALAKIAGIEMCWSYNRQYGTRYLAAMPTNLYGPGDNFDLNTSHVLPALIRKTAEAIRTGAGEITVWGTGTPRRELLYSDDLAQACVHLLNLDEPRTTRSWSRMRHRSSTSVPARTSPSASWLRPSRACSVSAARWPSTRASPTAHRAS